MNSIRASYTVWSVKSINRQQTGAIIIATPDKTPIGRTATRRRILDAAQDLAQCTGAGSLSLDAVAAKAGVSKGGLLYHFPSKNKLMEALVEDYLRRFDTAMSLEERLGGRNAAIRAYIAQFLTERHRHAQPHSGLLAALAKDPLLLAPVQRHERDFLSRIRGTADDAQLATLAFLAIQGIRAMELLNTQVIDAAEEEALITWLKDRLGEARETDPVRDANE